MSLYTLTTLACLPERVSARLAGSSGLSTDECEAQFHFWRGIGSWMGIEDIPDTRGELLTWMHAFEDERFAATTECHAIAKAPAWEWADY